MARASLSVNQNTTPSTSFHRKTFGQNIVIEDNGLRALRHTSFDNGITFTSKPIQMNERICMKIIDIDQSNQWLGSLAVGFTQFDPASLQGKDLCKSALPNLCLKTGTSYIKRIFETLTKEIIITFYYNQDGAFYILDGIEHDLCKYVDTKKPLWGVIDIYGNVKSIVFTTAPQVTDGSREIFQKYDQRPDELPNQYFKRVEMQHIGFLDTHGPELELFCQNVVVFRRNVPKLTRPYLFLDFPMVPGDQFYIRILSIDPNYRTPGVLGFTNAARSVFVENFSKLPSGDPMALYDRKEFWILSDSAFHEKLSELDEYRFTFEQNGDIQMCRNNDTSSVQTIACSDPDQKFYPFFFLNGRINALSLMGVVSQNRVQKKTDSTKPAAADSDANLCQVCYDEPANLVLIPCGHIFFCSGCKDKYEKSSGTKCPVCRENYTMAIEIASD